MKSAALGSVRITGLTSISDLSLELSTPVTVLIGPNGSGKSNLVGALELLGRIIDGQLQDYVVRRGGFAGLLHRSARPAGNAELIAIEVWGEQTAGLSNGYRAVLTGARGDETVVAETMFLHDANRHPKPYDRQLGLSRESRLREAAEDPNKKLAGIAGHVLPILTGCRVFHFHDTSSDAPVKRRVDDADNLTLAPDARNIAPLLARLRSEDATRYRRIVRAVQTVAPFFGDFVLEPEGGRYRLRWQEKGIDNVFSADELSDGSLRFICLATLLLQPDRPSVVVLDEPELGLHPFAINQLAELIRGAATGGNKVVLATQSVTLLSHFDAVELTVVERGIGGTTATRLDVEALADWLAEYSLGDLWEKNVLGGRPRPDSAVPPVEAASQ
jgi:predicted ATPase